jgi:small basic protein
LTVFAILFGLFASGSPLRRDAMLRVKDSIQNLLKLLAIAALCSALGFLIANGDIDFSARRIFASDNVVNVNLIQTILAYFTLSVFLAALSHIVASVRIFTSSNNKNK